MLAAIHQDLSGMQWPSFFPCSGSRFAIAIMGERRHAGIANVPEKAGRLQTGREMDQSSLLRWLSEAVMFPTALLPGEHLAWKPIDSKSAKAAVRNGELTASAIFYFDKRGTIRKVVTADKYRDFKGKPEKAVWIGYFHNYQRKSGILVPTQVGATWKLPRGNINYARFKLVEIDYDQPFPF